jgi:hypothetical protein
MKVYLIHYRSIFVLYCFDSLSGGFLFWKFLFKVRESDTNSCNDSHCYREPVEFGEDIDEVCSHADCSYDNSWVEDVLVILNKS